MAFGAQLGVFEPVCWELFSAISHVFTAKYTKLEHFLRSQFRPKIRMEVLPRGFGEAVAVTSLHKIVDSHLSSVHL